MKHFFSFILVLFYNYTFSQDIIGFNFSNVDSIINKEISNKGFVTNNYWKSSRGNLFGKEVYLYTKSTEIFKVKYEYQFVFNTVFDSEKIFVLYDSINNSIIKNFNTPDEIITENDTSGSVKNPFSKNISNNIKYITKWNKSTNRKFSICTQIKSDANIYLTIIDSSKYVSKLTEDSLLQSEIQKQEKKDADNKRALINKLQNSNIGICLINYEAFDVSEYTAGTGFRINVFNPTKKIVKYINVSFVGYNPVNDRVINKYGNSYINSVKCVGPIKPLESGEYEWEYIWFNDLVEKVKIISIVVEYMDGSKKVINDIKKVEIDNLSSELKDFVSENVNN